MKTMSFCRACLSGCWLTLAACSFAAATPADSLCFERILLDFQVSVNESQADFQQRRSALGALLSAADSEIANTAGRKNSRYRKALEKKIALMQQITALEAEQDADLLKIRYRKGIDLIKLMYEKILGLDHHFSGLHTYQNISALSNPNNFPEFKNAQEMLDKHKNKRFAMRLPAVLESNPFISATFTLVSVLLGESSQKQKEQDVEKVACILDFTVRMNADLSLIRHETEFLKNANQSLLEDCERLFQEYTKPVGYFATLETCRKNDDWETLYERLNEYMDVLAENEKEDDSDLLKELVNLEFATQRAADFVGKYSQFIAQGEQYYRKFDFIVSTYQHETVCAAQLPRQFGELKADIQGTIDKFNNTYYLPELQGSRLKGLMYGVAE